MDDDSMPREVGSNAGLGAAATYEACDFEVLTGKYMSKPFGVLMHLPNGYAAYRSPMGGQPRFARFADAQDLAASLNRIAAPNDKLKGRHDQA